jgi:3-hydroxybutyryl-CoA dehydratase
MNARLRLKDVRLGLEYLTPAVVVTEAHIVNFSGLSGDFFDVHMDDEFAKSVGFPGRVAHGLLCLSLIDGLKNRSSVLFDAVASLEWLYKFKQAVFPGDRIQGRIRVVEVRPTKNPERGILRLQFEVFNQNGDVVQHGENVLMVVA